jgi:hypothetical protein
LWREIKDCIPLELQDQKRGTIVEWK